MTNEHSVEVEYSSEHEDVAQISSEGTITLVNDGETTITASFAGDETYNADEASYTLTVYPADTTTHSIQLGLTGYLSHNYVSLDENESVSEGEADEGDTVNIYPLANVPTSCVELKLNNESDIAWDNGVASFTMPADDAAISQYVYREVTLTGSAASNAQVNTESNGLVPMNSTIVLTALEGYTFDPEAQEGTLLTVSNPPITMTYNSELGGLAGSCEDDMDFDLEFDVEVSL